MRARSVLPGGPRIRARVTVYAMSAVVRVLLPAGAVVAAVVAGVAAGGIGVGVRVGRATPAGAIDRKTLNSFVGIRIDCRNDCNSL